MSLYYKIKTQIVPPLFLIVFTSSVQFLALFGRGDEIKWEHIISGLTGNTESWRIVAVTFLWAYFWLLVSCQETKGRTTSDGYVPIYKDNGVSYYFITASTYLTCQWLWPNLSSIIYENMPEILGSMNTVALLLCTYLFFNTTEKEKLPPLYLFYRGGDLHPKIFNVQVKQLIIVRISMMFWQIQVFAFFFAAWDRRPLDMATTVTCLIQTVYLYKMFTYESAYFHTLDITLDRAGYYLIWGCLVWVPCLYGFNSYYLVKHVPIVSNQISILILIFGILTIYSTALVDFEKAKFRKSNGEALVWNRRPTYIKATYVDENGIERISLLLTSGFWGLARHLNYTLELLANLSWALTGYGLGIPVYFCIIFLTILILHRIYRDEHKCASKYGKYWKEYCKTVPYRLIPNIF